MSIDITSQSAVGPVPDCHLSCQNGGYCTHVSAEERTTLEIFTGGGGDMCRDPATSYCGQAAIRNRDFCTNGGLCKVNLSFDSGDLLDSTHGGCHCPPEFEGPHCEYLKGMAPIARKEVYLKRLTDKMTPPKTQTNDGLKAKEITAEILSSQDITASMVDTNIFANVRLCFAIAMSVISLVIVAARLWRTRRKRSRRDILDRYRDEAPVRVRIMGEVESLENGGDGYHVHNEDLYSISECSIEEIDFQDSPAPDNSASLMVNSTSLANSHGVHLQQIRDGVYETYFDAIPDFTDIIGTVLNEEQT